MTSTPARTKPQQQRLAPWKALLLALPMLLLSFMMLTGGTLPVDLLQLASGAVTWLFLNTLFFLMLHTGHTHRYRSILFIVMALGFIVSFSTTLLTLRGSITLTGSDMISGKTPFCHLVIPMVLIPAALTRTIIFPGSLLGSFASIASMLVLWIGASLGLGRGWCSWTCFYGGLDEGFSRLVKKPRIKKIDRKWTYLPYAVLLVIVLTSAVTLSPTYCEWLCPFKAVTEFVRPDSLLVWVQTGIFGALFLGTVVTLPILTKRRTQCGLFCPFGAFQAFTNKVSAIDVRIDPETCSHCGLCLRSCPTFSLDERSLESGRPLITCTKCGQCVDLCPKGAISYHVKGTAVGLRPNTARVLFLYPAMIFFAAIGGSMIAGAVYRILLLITTGSML